MSYTITKTRDAAPFNLPAPTQDNYPAATAGGGFYPEMGGKHDGKALFVIRVGYKGYNVKWIDARNTEALAAFASLRIRPRHASSYDRISDGVRQWSACVTWAAGDKLQAAKLSVLEMLLD